MTNEPEVQQSEFGTSQLYLNNALVEIHEIKHSEEPEKPAIRVWCTQFPNSFNVQFRVNDTLDTFHKTKKRNMIATAHLSVRDLETILDYMRNEENRMTKK